MESGQPQQEQVGVCYQFQRSGKCRFGTSCKFSHVQQDEAAPPRRKNKPRPRPNSKPKPKTAHPRQGKTKPGLDNPASLLPSPPPSPPSYESLLDPMDEFFSAYPDFAYNRNKPFTRELQRMFRQFRSRWMAAPGERREAQASFRIALVNQFNTVYGTDEHSLESWQRLCRILGLGAPPTLKKAKRAVRNTHINLVDLVECHRTGTKVQRFATLDDLREYTIDNKKYFPKEEAYEGGLLRMLLREILHARTKKRPGAETAASPTAEKPVDQQATQ